MLIRRFFAFVISAFLIFFPVYSYATTSVGGWSALDTVTAGATNTINAAKTAGGKALKSAITIAPQAGKVGKHLLKGGGAAALLFAVPQILGEGVEWVLDPANNSVRYIDPAAADSGDGGSVPVGGLVASLPEIEGATFASPSSLCAAAAQFAPKDHENPSVGSVRAGDFGASQVWDCGSPPWRGHWATPKQPPAEGGSVPEGEQKYLPISTVAAQVISNAEAGHAPSQEAVKATALEGFAAGEHDAALDAAATEAGTDAGTENPPDTENPPTDAPVPFDPSSIIAAINSLKAMLAGILSSMTGFFDWMKAPVPPDEEKKDVPFATTGDVGLDSVDRYEQRIDFSGQCPVNDFSFTMMGVTYAKPIPYYHFCGFLEQIAPWLLAMCYLGTAYFVVENI